MEKVLLRRQPHFFGLSLTRFTSIATAVAILSIMMSTFSEIAPKPRLERFASARRFYRRNFPFLIASGIYIAITLALLVASYYLASRHFIYALDDTYINMALAKNFAAHGVWGVTPFEFSSCTSTPLFVLLMSSVYWLIGPSQHLPFALSWLFGLASIYAGWRITVEYLDARSQMAALVAFVLLPPLFVVGTLGMEHSLHLLLTLLFIQRFVADDKSIWPISVITMAMVATRYEGLFVAIVGVLILALSRQWIRALSVGLSAAIFVLTYALFSVSHHGYWLPNSVALKGAERPTRAMDMLDIPIWNSTHGPHLFFLLSATAIIAVWLRGRNPKLAKIGYLIAGAGLLHLSTAGVGWAYRYEDYLIACGVLVIACALPQFSKSRGFAWKAALIPLTLAGALLLSRSLVAGMSLPVFSRAIYQQQWQMANFLRAYYPGASVAANDIGAINFMSDLHCLDLTGLANSDIFWAKHNHAYTTQFLADEAASRGVTVALVYDSWFTGQLRTRLEGPPLPASWIRVESWRTPKRSLGEDVVSFYASNQTEAERLKANLDQFAKTLPVDVDEMP